MICNVLLNLDISKQIYFSGSDGHKDRGQQLAVQPHDGPPGPEADGPQPRPLPACTAPQRQPAD